MAKKEDVMGMFNNIAREYDRLNHLLSLNMDKRWRKAAIKHIPQRLKNLMLDVACGTGDLSIESYKTGVKQVIGVDISENMLEIGRRKIDALGYSSSIRFECADCEHLPFQDNFFDVVTVAFGVRNFENLENCLKEMFRVTCRGGKVIILEFSMPDRFPIKQLYHFYFRHILPTVGGWISGNKGAYTYLPESVMQFPQGDKFIEILIRCGYSIVECKKLSCGIASIYTGMKG